VPAALGRATFLWAPAGRGARYFALPDARPRGLPSQRARLRAPCSTCSSARRAAPASHGFLLDAAPRASPLADGDAPVPLLSLPRSLRYRGNCRLPRARDTVEPPAYCGPSPPARPWWPSLTRFLREWLCQC
jgi:hypothetical protein